MPQKSTSKSSSKKEKSASPIKRLKHSGKYTQVWLFFSLAIAVIAGYFIYTSLAAPTAPTVYLSPASQTLGPNTTFTVQVREDSGTTPVNAVQANFSYPAALVDFVSISTTGTAFTTDAPSSGGSGQVSIARGIIGNLTGDKLIATVTFKTKTTSGTANMAFTTGTALVSSSSNQNLLASLASTGGGSYVVDNTPPTVSVSSPANGATLSAGGNITITTTASDSGSGIASVEVYIDGTKVSTLTTSPYTYTWNTSTYSLGSHTIQSKATDGMGNVTNSSVNTVNLADQTAPSVSITAPSAGAKVSGTINVTASAADNTGGTGVSKVEFYVDGALKSTDSSSPYSYSWNTSTSADGSHSLTAKAYDGASTPNTQTSSAVSVSVDNTAPTVPGNLRTTSVGMNSVSLAWNASTDAGGVTSYRVSRDSTTITTTSGTTYTDASAQAGKTYIYTVVALDGSGNTSSAASLSVTTPAPKPGDVNGDGAVNITDLSVLLNAWGTSSASSDLNSNGTVDIFDLSILLYNYGT